MRSKMLTDNGGERPEKDIVEFKSALTFIMLKTYQAKRLRRMLVSVRAPHNPLS